MLNLKTATSWTVAGLAALTVLAAPLAEANACDPHPCEGSDRFSTFYAAHDSVATDGVLVFEGHRGAGAALTDAEAAEHVTLRIADGDDTELSGTLEAADGFYIWRPDAAFPAGAQLSVDIEIDNASIDDIEACSIDPLASTISVTQGPLPKLALPAFDVETSYEFRADRDYPSLVCCDGAYPADVEDSCGGISPSWGGTGHCAFQDGVGFARATVQLGEALAPEVAAALRFELVADGEVIASRLGSLPDDTLSLALDRAFSLEVHAISLIDGSDIASDPIAIDGGADMLGEHTRDVQAELATNCEMPAYICEVGPVDDGPLQGWDADACEPFVPDDSDSETDGETDGSSDTEGESEGEAESDGETDGGSASASDTDGDDSDSDSGAADDDAGGCGCQADAPRTGLGWMALFGLGLVWRRRRPPAVVRTPESQG